MGDRSCKVYSLVDVDYANLPSVIRPYANIEVNNTSMPVDLVSIVDSVPGADCVVFNQMVFVPNQKRELALLDKKKNRHASMPNPSNLMAVEDIKRVQEVIARGHPHQQAGLQPVGAVRQLFPRQLLWHECRLRPIPHPRRCRHLSDVQGAHRA